MLFFLAPTFYDLRCLIKSISIEMRLSTLLTTLKSMHTSLLTLSWVQISTSGRQDKKENEAGNELRASLLPRLVYNLSCKVLHSKTPRVLLHRKALFVAHFTP